MADGKLSRPLTDNSAAPLAALYELNQGLAPNENTPEIKRTRACDNCRALKVKCVPSVTDNLLAGCIRCHKSKKACIFKFGPRKRRRRTDMRVSELEKKLEVLTATLDKDGSEVEPRVSVSVSETEPDVPVLESSTDIVTSYPVSRPPAAISHPLSPTLIKDNVPNNHSGLFSEKLQLPHIQSLSYPPVSSTSLLPPVQLLHQPQHIPQGQSNSARELSQLNFNYKNYDNGYLALSDGVSNARRESLPPNISSNMAFKAESNEQQFTNPRGIVSTVKVPAPESYSVEYHDGHPSVKSTSSVSESLPRESPYGSEKCDVDSIPEQIILEEASTADISANAPLRLRSDPSPNDSSIQPGIELRNELNSDNEGNKTNGDNIEGNGLYQPESVRARVMRSWIHLSKIAETRMQMLSAIHFTFSYPLTPHNDVIASGMISMEEAQIRLDSYRDRITPRFYIMPIPPDLTVEEFRQTHPLLFLGVMSTASIVLEGTKYLESSYKLLILNFRTLMNEVVVVGNKSFEVLQSLVLTILWYNSPELYHHQKAYMFNFITASIANDLGISGSYEGPVRAHSSFKYDKIIHPYILSDPRTRDCRRLWLCIYFSSVNTCLLNRRNAAVSWNDYTEECCQVLESEGSSDADIKVAKFARLMESLEGMTKTFHSNDVRPPLDFNDARTKYLVHIFKKKLDLVYEDTNTSMDYILEGTYHSLLVYLYETSIYCPMLGDNSRTPFSEYALNYNIKLTPAIIEAVSYLTDSSTKCVEAFSNLSVQELSVLPIYYYARMAFSASMVLKLRALCYIVPGFSDICPLADSNDSLQLVTKLEDKLDEVRTLIPFANSASTFTFILRLLVFHYDKQIYQRRSQVLDINSGENAAPFINGNNVDYNTNDDNKNNGPQNPGLDATNVPSLATRYELSNNGADNQNENSMKTEYRGNGQEHNDNNNNNNNNNSAASNINNDTQLKADNNNMSANPSGARRISTMFNTGAFNEGRSYSTFSLSELTSNNAAPQASMTTNLTESMSGYDNGRLQNEEDNMVLESLMKGDDFWSDLIPSLESFAGFDN